MVAHFRGLAMTCSRWWLAGFTGSSPPGVTTRLARPARPEGAARYARRYHRTLSKYVANVQLPC
jgi:hypothetical protein